MTQLTDEEILHALEHCEDCIGCAHCIYTHKNIECNNTNDATKLIHRLQNEVSQFKSKAEHIEEVYNADREHFIKTSTEQKAEIERLTEEKWQVQDDLDNYHAMYQVEIKAKAELQKQVDELTKELANERNAVITFQESANAHRLKVGEVMKQNAELQKQVEELKVYLASEKVCSKQAVKYTAKEILQEGKYNLSKSMQEWICERYGVEV